MEEETIAEFERLVGDHLDMLFTLSRRLTDTSHDAEDLVQDTCLDAWRAWHRGEEPEAPRAWLATLCLNRARSRWRRRAVRPLEHLTRDVRATASDPRDATRSVESIALANVEASWVRELLDQLPAPQREAICLMDLCGFTASEAGRILGAPRNTILSRVHRGRQQLALLLIAQEAPR